MGLIAPSSPLNDRGAVGFAVTALREMDIKPVLGDFIYAADGYLAGSDEERVSDINRFLRDPDIRGMFAVRGGYGVLRLLHLIDYDAFALDPKIVMGFSDLTTLVNALSARTGVITFHGPTLTPTFFTRAMQASFRDMFMRPNAETTFRWDHAIISGPGVAQGTLWGGNLTSMAAMVGTPYCPPSDGAIMLIEDVNESPCRLERMLMQFKLAGKLDVLAGIIAGRFHDCAPRALDEDVKPWAETLETMLRAIGIPALREIDVGHIPSFHQSILPIGALVRLNAEDRSLHAIGNIVS